MFTKANSCPVCFTPWEEVDGRCGTCGSIAELYFERPLPDKGDVDQQKIEETIDRVRSYLVDHENHGQARYTLGLSYVNMSLLPEGLAEVRRAAQLLPEKVQVAYEAVVLAAKQRDFSDEVMKQIDRVIERKPDFKEALYLRGVMQWERNQRRKAVKSWQQAYALDANYEPAHRELRRFIDENVDLLRNPAIAAKIDTSSLPLSARDYLRVISSDVPVKPAALGETSMKVLEDIWAEKASLMRQIYADNLRQYEKSVEKRNLELAVLEDDVIAISTLCIAAVDDRVRLDTAITTRGASSSGKSSRRLSVTERSRILDAEVQTYQRQGYSLIARTETTAQLSKKHEFSCCLAVILTLLIIGIILYLLYYLTAKKEQLLFLEVDEFGQVHRTFS
jgi:tetratricopeptide (TPR) repeat protein